MEHVVYKVLKDIEFGALQSGSFAGAPVDLADGFIHLSTASQLAGTINKHFAGQTGLTIAAIDIRSLGQEIRWETSRDGALFPHLYGRLDTRIVIASCPLAWREDGTVELPAPS